MALMLLRHGATVTDREYSMALERLYVDVIKEMLGVSPPCGRNKRSNKFHCDANTLRVSNRKGKSLFSLGDVISSPMKTVVEAKFVPVRPSEGEGYLKKSHWVLGRLKETLAYQIRYL